MTWAALIPVLTQAASSVAGAAMSGSRSPYGETALQDQVNAMHAAKVYEEASLNPASPHARALKALIEAEQRQQVMQAIDALQRNQNRSRARGVLGALFNPERQDEAKAGGIAEAFAKIGQRSGAEASSRLSGAANQARGRAGGFNSINDLLLGYANNKNRAGTDMLGALGSLAQTPEFKDALSRIFGGTAPGGGNIDISGPATGLTIGDISKTSFVNS